MYLKTTPCNFQKVIVGFFGVVFSILLSSCANPVPIDPIEAVETNPIPVEPIAAVTTNPVPVKLIAAVTNEYYAKLTTGGNYTADLVFYLDTINLPTHNGNLQKLVLSDTPTTPIADGDRVEFFFSGTLATDIDPGIYNQVGWKVKISNAQLGYCKTCYMDTGLARIITLKGNLQDVQFIYDPEDQQEIYIRVTPSQ